MRVLFFGSTKGTACSLHYFTAFSRLGHQVLPFDPEYFVAKNPAEQLALRIQRGPSASKIKRVADQLYGLCSRNTFDMVFVMAENFLGWETFEAIRNGRKAPLFIYHSHDNNFYPGICKPKDFEKTLAAYDFVFTTKSQNVDPYKRLGQPKTFFIPSAYEPTVHRPIPDSSSIFVTKHIPVSFIGTYDASRDSFVERVGWENLWVWGNRWQRYPKYRQFKERIVPSAVYYFEFADIISHSDCSLGLLREEVGDRHTQRTFEIPACGGFQIAPRNEEIMSLFKENEEIVLFSSPEELKEKVDYYLKHPDERRRISSKGYERCLREPNTYTDRVGHIIRTTTEQNRGVSVSLDRSPLQNFGYSGKV